MSIASSFRVAEPVARRMVFYLTMGYPNWMEFFEVLDVLERHGVGFVELGIPSADPFLDGDVVRRTHEAVLSSVTHKDVATALTAIRDRYSFRCILMSYRDGAERLELYKLDRWLYDALLCVDEDLPVGEYSGLVHVFDESMDDETMRRYLSESSLFAYVAAGAKTGGDAPTGNGFEEAIRRIRQCSLIPAFVGFGIRTGDDVRAALEGGADGAIIGSEFLRRIDAGGPKAAEEYVTSLELAAVPPSWGDA